LLAHAIFPWVDSSLHTRCFVFYTITNTDLLPLTLIAFRFPFHHLYVQWSDMISQAATQLVGARTLKKAKVTNERQKFSAAVGRALRRAAKAARKTACMRGTPIYIWGNCKVVTEKPYPVATSLPLHGPFEPVNLKLNVFDS
jgi:hypothetical protein